MAQPGITGGANRRSGFHLYRWYRMQSHYCSQSRSKQWQRSRTRRSDIESVVVHQPSQYEARRKYYTKKDSSVEMHAEGVEDIERHVEKKEKRL